MKSEIPPCKIEFGANAYGVPEISFLFEGDESPVTQLQYSGKFPDQDEIRSLYRWSRNPRDELRGVCECRAKLSVVPKEETAVSVEEVLEGVDTLTRWRNRLDLDSVGPGDVRGGSVVRVGTETSGLEVARGYASKACYSNGFTKEALIEVHRSWSRQSEFVGRMHVTTFRRPKVESSEVPLAIVTLVRRTGGYTNAQGAKEDYVVWRVGTEEEGLMVASGYIFAGRRCYDYDDGFNAGALIEVRLSWDRSYEEVAGVHVTTFRRPQT